MSIPLKNTLLFLMLGLSGCIALGKTPASVPATLTDLQNETQRLQNIIELQNKQVSRQQTELAAQLNTDLENIQKKLTTLDRTINTLDTTTPATVIISDEQCPAPLLGQTPDGKLLLGEAEWLWLDAADRAFRTRIDTGAATSSINAADITRFERNGKDWARFFINYKGKDDRTQIEAPLVRHARVRQASADDLDRRPVVLLSVRVGDQNEKTEFTLTDRSRMKYPVLLGRDFLKDIAVVDVARKYIQPKPRLKDVR